MVITASLFAAPAALRSRKDRIVVYYRADRKVIERPPLVDRAGMGSTAVELERCDAQRALQPACRDRHCVATDPTAICRTNNFRRVRSFAARPSARCGGLRPPVAVRDAWTHRRLAATNVRYRAYIL